MLVLESLPSLGWALFMPKKIILINVQIYLDNWKLVVSLIYQITARGQPQDPKQAEKKERSENDKSNQHL